MSDPVAEQVAQSPPEETGPPEINPEEVVFDEHKDLIGSGTYGKVYRGTFARLALRRSSTRLRVPQTECQLALDSCSVRCACLSACCI